MPIKNIIQVSEFEKLYYDDDKPFKKEHWEALCRYLEKQKMQEEKGPDYFRILNKGIQFTHYVGVIQAGNLTIEVLPKIDNRTATADNGDIDVVKDESKQLWHQALLQMLQECSLLKINQADFANLKLRHQSLLTFYLQLFLIKTEDLVHEGLLMNYAHREGNQTTLKGQLQFQKQVAGNNVHGERFYVRYTAYQHNHLYNQILFKALQMIPHISNDHQVLDRAAGLLARFPQTDAVTINADTFNRLSFDRKTERYRDVLEIAKMLLLHYRPDVTGGREHVLAILFDMNMLWEEWVYRRLKKEEARFDVIIQRQQTTDFWKGRHLLRYKTIRPDIVITKGSHVIIIDTKWKQVTDMTPDDDDLKQMFIYNLYWQCSKSVLLYPANETNIKEGSYKDFMKEDEVHSHCVVLTATIFRDNLLDKDFAKKILEKIFEMTY